MATLKNTTFSTTSSVTLPNNSTSTAAGLAKLRYNTSASQNTLEFYDTGTWRPVTGYSAGVIGTGGNSISYIPGGGIAHLFTSVGASTFTPAFTGTIEVLVVAGGGGGGSSWGGGGGGGGVILNRSFPVSSGTPYSVTVGNRGPNSTSNGQNSVFASLTATGGGCGGTWTHSQPGFIGRPVAGRPGGSGGGGANTGDGINSRTRCYGGEGTSGQGYPGGSGIRFNADSENTHNGGGGGGAGGGGGSAPDGRQNYRGSFRSDQVTGGAGRAADTLGSTYYFGGGGGGGGHLGWGTYAGGIGGGGGGGYHHAGPYGNQNAPNPFNTLPGSNSQGRQFEGGGGGLNNGAQCNVTVGGGNGGANTGGGGGAHNGLGGSGVVIIRY